MDRVLHERFGLEKHIRELSVDRTLIKAPQVDEMAWEQYRVRGGRALDGA